MDFDSLKSQVSNLTLYDLKAGVRKVQNAVMNLTEMESMVREATNADPWGAPSSLMQQIASGTHNYQQLNEIMPMIYKRFTDKTAEEWRQIYKALQLLEFLVKNGSERVVDDARSHLSLIKMLRQFHYIDQNGKDQGINVRNRSAELGKLLGDVEMIRAERKKARINKNTSSIAPTSAVTSPTTQQKPLQPAGGFKPAGPNYFTSVRADINTPGSSQPASFASRPSATPSTSAYTSSTSMASLGKPTPKPAASSGGDAFGSIWSTASTKAGVQQKAAPSKGPGMAAMQKEKSSAGIWGAASSTPPPGRAGAQNPPMSAQSQKPATPLGNGLDDLLG